MQHQDFHYRGQWFDDLTVFWKDFAKPGPLPERHYEAPRATRHMQQFPEHGTLAAKVTVPPGERKTIRFVISWSFPHGDIYWAYRNKPDGQIPDQQTPLWTQLLRDAVGRLRRRAPATRLRAGTSSRGKTLRFRDSLFGSTMPARDQRCGVGDAGAAPHRHRASGSRTASSGPGKASTGSTARARARARMCGTTSRR